MRITIGTGKPGAKPPMEEETEGEVTTPGGEMKGEEAPESATEGDDEFPHVKEFLENLDNEEMAYAHDWLMKNFEMGKDVEGQEYDKISEMTKLD